MLNNVSDSTLPYLKELIVYSFYDGIMLCGVKCWAV